MVQTQRPIGIAAKPNNPDAAPVMDSLIQWLEQRNLRFYLDQNAADYLAPGCSKSASIIARENLTSECSPIVVLGGDGTLISVCRHAATVPPVIVGVNLGTLGFLTEITVAELLTVMESVIDGSAPLQERFLVDAQIKHKNGHSESFSAVNDIVITKDTLARIFTVDVYVDGIFAAPIRGDGVIVGTPGGSTAYSLAAGGSIVHPRVEALLLTPICSHSLTTRPLVLPGDSEIELCPADILNVGAVFLSVDGQAGRLLNENEKVVVRTSPHSFFFARSPSKTYYEVLGTKLKWATS